MFGALFPLLRPMIHRIDAETAHHATVKALECLPCATPPVDDPALQIATLDFQIANPVGIAAGFDKDARVADALLGLGFGFVEVGGVTPKPQPGNPRPRVFRLPDDGAVINRYGLNSEGVDAVSARLRARPRRGVVGVNLGANKDSTDRIADYVTLISQLADVADFLTLNISSPNTPGLRDLQGKAFLGELLERALAERARLGSPVRILLKIAPDIELIQLDDIIEVARAHGIDGMIVSNTTVARPATLRHAEIAREAGGLSGRPLFRPSTILLARTFQRVEGQFPLIGVGGIASGEDAVAKISAGASLLQLYSALVFQGPGLIREIKSALVAAVRREKAANVSELVGRNAAQWAEATT